MDRKTTNWIVLAVLAVVAGIVTFRALRGGSATTTEGLASEITVHFDDTSDDIRMSRGQLERAVIARIFQPGPLDAAVGITNPKTGKPTGFPTDRDYWNSLIEEAKQAAELNKKK